MGDEAQVAPWRMNIYNLDPNYTYQSSNTKANQSSQSPAFKPKSVKRSSNKESMIFHNSKKDSNIHSVYSKGQSGFVEAANTTNRQTVPEHDSEQQQHTIQKPKEKLPHLNNESIIGTSNVNTPSRDNQAQGIVGSVNISRNRINKISLDESKDKSSIIATRQNFNVIESHESNKTRNYNQDDTMPTAQPSHFTAIPSYQRPEAR